MVINMKKIKHEQMPLADLYPAIRATIEAGGEFLIYPNGESMLPTLRPGRDAVFLSRVSRIKRGDILLYQRENGAFVLHRVVKCEKGGTLSMRGDNQYYTEKGVEERQVVAAAKAFCRNGQRMECASLSHRAYLSFRTLTYPLRCFFFRARNKIRRTMKG
jgi:hypothetical protein